MKILALEFSTDHRGVAVIECVTDAAPAALSAVFQEEGRETRPLALIEAALAEAGLERSDIECLAVGLGPGSYTGIRMSIAIAQGWQLARPVRVLGVGSLECLALQAQQERHRGVIHLVVDAQRGEFYTASYDLETKPPRVVKPLRIVKRDDLDGLSRAGEVLAGPGVNRWFSGGRSLVPDAASLGIIASGRTDFTPAHELEPVYLRATRFVKAPPPRFVP